MSSLLQYRRRAPSTARDISELQKYLESLEASNKDSDILGRLQWLSLIHRALSSSTEAKDAFRNLNGFTYLIDSLTSIAGFYDSDRTTESRRHLFEFIKSLFGVISEALLNHAGNRRFFSKRVGFDTLQQGLAATGMPICAREELFGLLFRFAMDDATLATLFTAVREGLPRDDEEEAVLRVCERISAMFGSKDVLANPEAIPIILDFLFALPREGGGGEEEQEEKKVDFVAVAVLQSLLVIASVSKANLVAIHETGVFSVLLLRLWTEETPVRERRIMKDLARVLVRLGINKLDDAVFLYKRAMDNDEIAEFLLHGIRASRSPAHIQFDTSLHGYSALEMGSTGRPFPPSSATASGYTIVAWIRIDKFDASMHTTLFGIFDKTQKCFLLAYLERDTHRFILQTSMSGPNASVRFRGKTFREKTWYHIAIVHKKSKMALSTAKAALYVNGEFLEEVKCGYPQSPPPNTPTQLFIGIPIALSTRVGKGVVNTRWSLGTMHIFEDAVSDDIIAVFYRLGPRYYGNFQDSLGAFQTFEASAALHMRNELMHPGREEKSDIVSVIRNKASTLLPENKLMLSISPLALIDDEILNSTDRNGFLRGISKQASKNAHAMTRASSLILNAAVPNIDEALCCPQGVALLTGTPIVAKPQSLDEAAWRIGGCVAVCLKMVDSAKSKDQVCLAVKILFETIKESWRNSEAMERENGFGILCHLLRNKEDKAGETSNSIIGEDLLKIILEFVGYNFECPEESFIVNPLAFRILLVDFDLWKRAGLGTLKRYFGQFVTFARGSKYHHFNSRKLLKMRVVKKWLFALKSDMFKAEAIPYFMEAFRVIVTVNMGAEVMRSLALSITYSLHRDNPSKSLKFKRSTPGLRRQTNPDSASGTTTPRPNHLSVPGSSTVDFGTAAEEELKKTGLLVLKVYAGLLCDPASSMHIKKFAKTVTNKWLLYLLAESDPRVVLLGAKILARLLVLHGPAYVSKFAAPPAGGFTILRNRLKRWWMIPGIWHVCLSILFGLDIAKIDTDKPLSDLEPLIDVKMAVVYPEMFGVVAAMLKAGLTTVAAETGLESPDHSPSASMTASAMSSSDSGFLKINETSAKSRTRSRSLSHVPIPESQSTEEFCIEQSAVLNSVIAFLQSANNKCPPVRDFFVSTRFARDIFSCLFPVISSSDSVSAETELNSKDSALTFDGGDVVIRPLSVAKNTGLPVVRTLTIDPEQNSSYGSGTGGTKQKTLRRGSSFILVTSESVTQTYAPSSARLAAGILSPPSFKTSFDKDEIKSENSVADALTALIVGVFVDMVLERREFNGYQFFNLVPPGFQEHQAYFDSYILRRVLRTLKDRLAANMMALTEPKVLTNLGRFTGHMTDYVYDGLFLSGADDLLDFIGTVLEFLQRPEISRQKTVRLCQGIIGNLRLALSRILIYRLSELEEKSTPAKAIITFLNKLMYWQAVILSPENSDADFMKLVCYLLYTKLMDERDVVRRAATNIFRIVLVQKPQETAVLLNQADYSEPGTPLPTTPGLHHHHHHSHAGSRKISSGFQKIMEMDDETFLEWADAHKEELDAFFYGALSKTWEVFVSEENKRTEERSKIRVVKRKDTLKEWISEDLGSEDVYSRHVSATNHWMANIYAEQHLRHQRALQDRQDSTSYVVSMFAQLEEDLKRPGGLFEEESPATGKTGWKLDLTEGRNRMRKRLLPDAHSHLHNYQPKRKGTPASYSREPQRESGKHALSIEEDELSIVQVSSGAARDAQQTPDPGNTARDGVDDDLDDFEMVEDPRGEDEERYEDKNRKVLRSLQHGDAVDDVHNVSRLVGLKAAEGLLILGRNYLYLIDNFFQRSDGEIVNVWQAPANERDQYLQMVAGKDKDSERGQQDDQGHDSRHWPWEDLISISKRQFLFRDVALELFFSDGRSYLLTTISMKNRNALHAKLLSKASSISSSSSAGSGQQISHTEEAWRIESLRSPDSTMLSFGSKIANVFSSGAQNPATKRWLRGEISNFHYLMLVNTMAGRTFNDLTQYPVFPWVLADYTSEELDLTDPKTFRDFSKPMGAQTPERMREFRERYRSFEEIGDKQSPPFHYGTHYSSAMIVCSYLIRLQPFVQSYLLLQGGQFDHADRLFYSIERTWNSASRENMSDVRELIPEFFFLPEFLTNSNAYNFGFKQGTNEAISHVQLPPWAKGDPKIFIAKHREALECEYVSRHLHEWIDLIFGFKQRGESAVEATNVFHHLSYRGAIDLDAIEDEVERLATIGIIHNFGQTPYQVFSRAHPPREEISFIPALNSTTSASNGSTTTSSTSNGGSAAAGVVGKRGSGGKARLDRAVEQLIRLPFPVVEGAEYISRLDYSVKLEKVVASTPTRLFVPPVFDKYLEWGVSDGSIRVYDAASKKQLALFEHPHSGPLTTALFLNSTTLITTGLDCVLSIWKLLLPPHTKTTPTLTLKTSLFAHRHPITTTALSPSFSTLLTASSTDRSIILWDTNRHHFVRRLVPPPSLRNLTVSCAAINDVSGEIAVATAGFLTIFTLNGEIILSSRVCAEAEEVHSLSFYEGIGNEWVERELIFTGHRRGLVKVWEKVVCSGGWELRLVKTLNHQGGFGGSSGGPAGAMTAVLPWAGKVFTGEEGGRVYEWDAGVGERK